MNQNMYQLLNTTNVNNYIGFFLNIYCVDDHSITNRDTQQDANNIDPYNKVCYMSSWHSASLIKHTKNYIFSLPPFPHGEKRANELFNVLMLSQYKQTMTTFTSVVGIGFF
jgi:hypothetical protein